MQLDIDFVRGCFPAFSQPELEGWAFFENAGGSYACRQTIDALTHYYTHTKVQPYADYPASAMAGAAMDRSRVRWAEALGVQADDVHFGPSTSQNVYVLARAYADTLAPGDEVVVTNQDHEANTGAIRRAAESAGAIVREWRIDAATGLLDTDQLDTLLGPRTRLVTFPHASNIIGQENDVAAITGRAHEVGARVIVDGVSFAPHTIPDVGSMGADVYLFSLYKVYSVHQGVMVTQHGTADALPNQGHFFNASQPTKRLTPAGPDHAQIAAAAGVLDYIEDLDAHHGGSGGGLLGAVGRASAMWRDHESRLAEPVLDQLSSMEGVRVLGPTSPATGHRCPTIAFVPIGRDPAQVAARLSAHRVMASAGHFYAYRVLEGLDVDPDVGVVRVSWVHYTTQAEIDQLLEAVEAALS